MKKKTLVMLLSVAMIITTAAFGTIAYLTDTASVTNRFTVGNVSIDVDEAVVTPDGVSVDTDGDGEEDRTSPNPDTGEEGNLYHLLPGQTYTKDPTMTIIAGSEEAYVRMLVTLTYIDRIKAALGDGFMPGDHVDGYDADKWQYIGMTDGSEMNAADETVQTMTYEFRYHTTVAGMKDGAPADVRLEPLFTAFTVPGVLTGDQMAQLQPSEIRVVGQAIQVKGFDDADAAWAEFFPQENTGAADDTTDESTDDTAGETTTEDQQEDSAAGA